MRMLSGVALGLLLTASVVLAQPYRSFNLPKFTEPPILDGDRFTVADEWANTLGPLECSPSSILRDGEQFGSIKADHFALDGTQLLKKIDRISVPVVKSTRNCRGIQNKNFITLMANPL